jgi:hypothetical protein
MLLLFWWMGKKGGKLVEKGKKLEEEQQRKNLSDGLLFSAKKMAQKCLKKVRDGALVIIRADVERH